jgi:hypothetical protein
MTNLTLTPPSGFNLSRWAISHGGFTAFLLVLLLAAGTFALLRIGQKEDPDFTFRVMVVQAYWPGATTQEMQDQVVDKLERKLQETPASIFCAPIPDLGLPTSLSISRARCAGRRSRMPSTRPARRSATFASHCRRA